MIMSCVWTRAHRSSSQAGQLLEPHNGAEAGGSRVRICSAVRWRQPPVTRSQRGRQGAGVRFAVACRARGSRLSCTGPG